MTPKDFDAFLGIARAVRHLAPNPADEAARLGLIHLALRRNAAAEGNPPEDSLARAMNGASDGNRYRRAPRPDADEARVLALTLLAFAGDLPDPAEEADLVIPHDRPTPDLAGSEAVSLLGPYVFLNTSRDK